MKVYKIYTEVHEKHILYTELNKNVPQLAICHAMTAAKPIKHTDD